MGKKHFQLSTCELLSQPSPLKATSTAKPRSVKMKNSMSGFSGMSGSSPVRPGGKREMKGFWKSAIFLSWWTFLAPEMERLQQTQMKAVVGLGRWGARAARVVTGVSQR